MQLTQADKKAAKEGFKFLIVVGKQRKCYCTTIQEAKREAGAVGRVVPLSRMSYAAANPSPKRRHNPAVGGKSLMDVAYEKGFRDAERGVLEDAIALHSQFLKQARGDYETADDMVNAYSEGVEHAARLARPASRNPSLTKADKDVIRAFTEHRTATSNLLATDGQTLDGNFMGGKGIATWKAGKIHFHDLGSKTAQTVQRAVAKEAPRNWLAANPKAHEVGKTVGKYTKKGARAIGRGAKVAAKATGRFFKGAYEGFRAANPTGCDCHKNPSSCACAGTCRNPACKCGGSKVSNPTARGVDPHGARELAMFVVNDSHLYLRRLPEFAKNLATKLKRGTYDEAKAVKLIEYLTKEASQQYGQQYGHTFSPATRRAAAVELLPTVIEQAQEIVRAAPVRTKRNPSKSGVVGNPRRVKK